MGRVGVVLVLVLVVPVLVVLVVVVGCWLLVGCCVVVSARCVLGACGENKKTGCRKSQTNTTPMFNMVVGVGVVYGRVGACVCVGLGAFFLAVFSFFLSFFKK